MRQSFPRADVGEVLDAANKPDPGLLHLVAAGAEKSQSFSTVTTGAKFPHQPCAIAVRRRFARDDQYLFVGIVRHEFASHQGTRIMSILSVRDIISKDILHRRVASNGDAPASHPYG